MCTTEEPPHILIRDKLGSTPHLLLVIIRIHKQREIWQNVVSKFPPTIMHGQGCILCTL